MKLLISSVGRRNYIVEYFQECLGNKDEVYVINTNENSSGVFASTKSFIAPPISSEEYIPFLINFCTTNKINLLISLFDQDSMKIAIYKEEFEKNGITVGVSNKDVIETTFDKLKFAGFLQKINLYSPLIHQNDESIRNNIRNNKIKFPLILKPRWGTGSIATEKVESEAELFFFLEYLTKKMNRSYISWISSQQYNNEVIIQDYIEGEEYHLDIINDLNGNYISTFPKKKLEMRSGETDSAITLEDETLKYIGEKIGKKLKHVGILDVDLIKSETGEYYILDANARFGGGYPFSHIAGANIPACIISWANKQIPKEDWLRIKPGIISVKGIKLFKKEKSL